MSPPARISPAVVGAPSPGGDVERVILDQPLLLVGAEQEGALDH